MTAGPAAPRRERYFEDYPPGSVEEFGEITVSADEIVEFARRYDPQRIHTDPVAAAQGPYGGLIASGWHTTALMMRLLVERYLSDKSSLGSPGIDELRWLRPVRPGDRLSVRVFVIAATRSRSKPDRGLVRTRVEILNQSHEIVMSLEAMNLVRGRPAG
jgi:acyl dehydratase